jgi:glycosyltransferase involved in cell wall biosynthesis
LAIFIHHLPLSPAKLAQAKSLAVKISVLMVVRNEQAHILSALRSLLKQKLPPAEILIIDHFSTDGTFATIQDFRSKHPSFPLKAVQRKNNHLGRSRQELLSVAASPFVAFIDGDCEAPRDWLEQLGAGFQRERALDPLLAGVGGPNRLPPASEVHMAINLSLDHVFGRLTRSPQAYRPFRPVKVDHLATTNGLFLKSALIQVGGFSPLFKSCGEDLDLGLRLNDQGFHLMLLPAPVVINHCAQNFAEWLHRMFRFGRAQGRLLSSRGFEKHKPLAALAVGPLLLLLAFGGLFQPFFYKLGAFYVLLTLVFAFGVAGFKRSTRLGLPLWLNLQLSPLAYSAGLWIHLLRQFQTRQYFAADVFAHLKRGPAHFFALGIGLFQRLLHARTDSH